MFGKEFLKNLFSCRGQAPSPDMRIFNLLSINNGELGIISSNIN